MGTAWVAWLLPALWAVVFDQTGNLPTSVDMVVRCGDGKPSQNRDWGRTVP